MWHFNDHRSGRNFIYKNGLFYMPPKSTMYYIILKQKLFLFVLVINTHSCTHVYRKTYTGKLPSPGAIVDTSDEKIISNFAK